MITVYHYTNKDNVDSILLEAMMYKYGGKKYGGKNVPVNQDVSDLFVKLYEVTAQPLTNYERDNYFTPEVLVKGAIKPGNIKKHIR